METKQIDRIPFLVGMLLKAEIVVCFALMPPESGSVAMIVGVLIAITNHLFENSLVWPMTRAKFVASLLKWTLVLAAFFGIAVLIHANWCLNDGSPGLEFSKVKSVGVIVLVYFGLTACFRVCVTFLDAAWVRAGRTQHSANGK